MPYEAASVDWPMVILCPVTEFASAVGAHADADDGAAVVVDDIVAVIHCFPT